MDGMDRDKESRDMVGRRDEIQDTQRLIKNLKYSINF